MTAANWLLVVGLLAACGQSSEPAPEPEQPSAGELEARQTREQFRVVIASFHDDLAGGRLDAAYAELAPMVQVSVSRDALVTIAKHPAFAPGVAYHVDGGTIKRGMATMTGWLDGPSGRATIDLRCTAVAGAWRISGLQVDGKPVL
jgi:hypothetical protein